MANTNLNNIPLDVMLEHQGKDTFYVYDDIFGEPVTQEEILHDQRGVVVTLGETPDGRFQQEV